MPVPVQGETKLDKGLVFLKEKDILVSGDKWTIVMDFEVGVYTEVLNQVKQEIQQIKAYVSTNKFMFPGNFPRITTKPRNV